MRFTGGVSSAAALCVIHLMEFTMKKFLLVSAAATLLSTVGFAGAQSTPTVNWKTSNALIAGDSCRKDVDTFTIANGNDVSVVFTRLSVSLDEGNKLSARSQCTVRIPVDIVRGFYIGELTQTLTLGATKSDNASVSAGTRSTFFNIPVTSLNILAPSGHNTSLNHALLSDTRRDRLAVASFCNSWHGNNTLSGMFASNIAVAAERANAWEHALIGIDSIDVRWDILTGLFRCP